MLNNWAWKCQSVNYNEICYGRKSSSRVYRTRDLAETTLNERYGKDLVIAEEVEIELRLSPAERDLCVRPAMYWEDGECSLLLAKLSENPKTGYYISHLPPNYA